MNNKTNDLFNVMTEKEIVMHIDMNSYFATCEQQANPAWRGRPLGVCSYLHPKGTIIAASVEAKKIGIKTGTKVWEALQIDPKVVLVRDEPSKYRHVTRKIQNIFQSYTDKIENYSIDESFLWIEKSLKLEVQGAKLQLKVQNWEENKLNEEFKQEYKDAVSVAQEIKRRIKDEVGEWLTCSVGIAPTKFLAKVASDLKKPDGLVMIHENNVDEILGKLELTDIWGISWGLKRQLNALGVFKPLDLKYAKPSWLMNKMGKWGYFLWARMNGIEIDRMNDKREDKQKSIGHSYTLLKKTANKEELAMILMKLCEKAGRRMRKNRLTGDVFWIGWNYLYGGGFTRRQKLDENTNDSWSIFQNIYKHLKNKVLTEKVSKIFISISGLKAQQIQLSIFEDKLKKQRLVKSLDKINDLYGEGAITRGMRFNWGEQISDRVSFGK